MSPSLPETLMLKAVVYIPSALCLAACLAIPVLYLHRCIDAGTYNAALLAASLGWFLCAAALAARRKRS